MDPITLTGIVKSVLGALAGPIIPLAKRNQTIANILTKQAGKSKVTDFLAVYIGACYQFLEERKEISDLKKDKSNFRRFFESEEVIVIFQSLYYSRETDHSNKSSIAAAFHAQLQKYLEEKNFKTSPEQVVFYDLVKNPSVKENLESVCENFCAAFYEQVSQSRSAAEVIRDGNIAILLENTAPGDRLTSLPKYLSRTPPDPPANFTGRESELDDLHRSLQNGETLYLLSGIGGIGKTALALKYLKVYREEYDHIAWLEVNSSLEAALADQTRRDLPNLVIPEDLEAGKKVELIRDYLGNLPGKNLLVYDNANDANNIRDYRKNLPNWSVLITSRADLSDLPNRKRLDVLPLEKARDYFITIYPLAAEDSALLDDLLEAVGRHTLAIEALAKTLLNIRSLDLGMLYAQLKEKGLLNLSLNRRHNLNTDWKKGRKDLRVEETDLKKLLSALYDLADLPRSLLEILRRWCLLPAGWMPWEHIKMLFAGEEDLETQLSQLVDGGWLDLSAPAEKYQYKMHQIIREVVADQLQPQAGQEKVDRLIGIAEEIMKMRPLGIPITFAPYASEIAGQVEGISSGLAHLNAQLGEFYQEIGSFPDALVHNEAARSLFASLGEKENLAISYSKLGSIYQGQGKMDEALKYYEADLKLTEELHISNPDSESLKNGLAISYSKLGEIYQGQGKMDEALKYYEDETRLFEELHISNPTNYQLVDGLAISYYKLGSIHLDRKDDVSALEYFEKSRDIFVKLFEQVPIPDLENKLRVVSNVIDQLK